MRFYYLTIILLLQALCINAQTAKIELNSELKAFILSQGNEKINSILEKYNLSFFAIVGVYNPENSHISEDINHDRNPIVKSEIIYPENSLRFQQTNPDTNNNTMNETNFILEISETNTVSRKISNSCNNTDETNFIVNSFKYDGNHPNISKKMSTNTHIDFIHHECNVLNLQDRHGCYDLEEIREKVDRSDTIRFNTTPADIQNSDTSTGFDPDEITSPGSGNDSRGSKDFQSFQTSANNTTGSSQENPLQARSRNILPDSGNSVYDIVVDTLKES